MNPKLVEAIKTNATVLSSIATFIGTVIGGMVFLDNRYAQAEEYHQQQNVQTRAIQQLQQSTAIQFEHMQLNNIDDKLFYLEQKPSRTIEDSAQISRFQRQRQDVADRIRTLQGR